MFDTDFDPAPTGPDLLAELGIDPLTVREVGEDDRGMRCPDRPVLFPDRRFADRCREAALAEPPGPAAVPRPAGWRSRRA